MSKSDEQRFDATLETLQSLAQHENMVIYKGYAGVLEWLGQQPDRASAKQKVGAALSLSYQLRSSPAITAFRDALRALLLLQITRYAMSGAPLKAIKERAFPNPVVARTKVVQEITALCGPITILPGGILIDTRVYHWSAVNRFADIGQTLRAGRDTGLELLQRAYLYVAQGTDPYGYYARWFGTANAATVLTNLKNLMDIYQTRTIGIHADEVFGSLRPLHASAVRKAFSAAKVIQVNLGAHFYSKTAQHSHQIVYDKEHMGYLDRAFELSEEREQVRADFFRELKKNPHAEMELDAKDPREIPLTAQIRQLESRLPKGAEQISVAGVILHEVTHNGIDTDDVVEAGQTMYGPNYCNWLARVNPAKSLLNADSYRLFCEQFMLPRVN